MACARTVPSPDGDYSVDFRGIAAAVSCAPFHSEPCPRLRPHAQDAKKAWAFHPNLPQGSSGGRSDPSDLGGAISVFSAQGGSKGRSQKETMLEMSRLKRKVFQWDNLFSYNHLFEKQ